MRAELRLDHAGYLAEVHVAVDQSRRQEFAATVYLGVALDRTGTDFRDPVVLDADIGVFERRRAFRREERDIANDCSGQGDQRTIPAHDFRPY